MTDLAELWQRVEALGARFRGTAEEDRKHNERLLSLLSLVEKGFARGQHEIKRLSEELARANEENQQIHAMLQTLLAEGEDTGARGTGTTMRELEDRINCLVETASSISGAAGSDAPEMTKDSPATVNTDEDDRAAAGSELDTDGAVRPPEEVSEEAPTAAEEVESKPVRKLDSETRETSTVIPVLTAEAAEESESTGAEDGAEKEPTLQDIIERISLQSGTLGEEQEQANTSPDPDAAPEENKKAQHRATSVRRHT